MCKDSDVMGCYMGLSPAPSFKRIPTGPTFRNTLPVLKNTSPILTTPLLTVPTQPFSPSSGGGGSGDTGGGGTGTDNVDDFPDVPSYDQADDGSDDDYPHLAGNIHTLKPPPGQTNPPMPIIGVTKDICYDAYFKQIPCPGKNKTSFDFGHKRSSIGDTGYTLNTGIILKNDTNQSIAVYASPDSSTPSIVVIPIGEDIGELQGFDDTNNPKYVKVSSDAINATSSNPLNLLPGVNTLGYITIADYAALSQNQRTGVVTQVDQRITDDSHPLKAAVKQAEQVASSIFTPVLIVGGLLAAALILPPLLRN